jgi:L,D-transpeptidase catalytic domain
MLDACFRRALYCSSSVAGRANPPAVTPEPAIEKTKTTIEKNLFVGKFITCGRSPKDQSYKTNLYYIALFTYLPFTRSRCGGTPAFASVNRVVTSQSVGAKQAGDVKREAAENLACRLRSAMFFACGACLAAQAGPTGVIYHLEPAKPLSRFDSIQITLLEKLNRVDRGHLVRLKHVILPSRWDLDELAYSPMPHSVSGFAVTPKALVVDLSTQLFGAYEFGNSVRWGPVSSGDRLHPTPAGLYHLNWHARIRISSENDEWVMPWYFNFSNKIGLGLHQYTLPGRPASHGCVRLLLPDAKWLFNWGQGWELAADGQVLANGTPVMIVGGYDYEGARPWLLPEWWARGVTFPASDLASMR